ncbi:hypothetical protein [Halioxenophilus sp. WMMB6]|uniref:hypothetical protein n=1 Tax=Halioxenophilus sp. WMMB6 TaxID=3073815 RepID=UPI00295E950A|nr:hypothetical protein [Halioxenophilus sp. WMMB6]
MVNALLVVVLAQLPAAIIWLMVRRHFRQIWLWSISAFFILGTGIYLFSSYLALWSLAH